MTEEIKVGDRVTWETEKRVGRDIKVEPLSGNVTQKGKGWVVVNYAPGKFRQVTIGTLNLRKVVKEEPEKKESEVAA